MQYRDLGHGLTVSAIGIGCMPMIKNGNILYGEAADLDESTAAFRGAAKTGCPPPQRAGIEPGTFSEDRRALPARSPLLHPFGPLRPCRSCHARASSWPSVFSGTVFVERVQPCRVGVG